MLVKYLIYTVLSRFQICRNLRVFPSNVNFQNFTVHEEFFFSRYACDTEVHGVNEGIGYEQVCLDMDGAELPGLGLFQQGEQLHGATLHCVLK